jgi:hypothetical protein
LGWVVGRDSGGEARPGKNEEGETVLFLGCSETLVGRRPFNERVFSGVFQPNEIETFGVPRTWRQFVNGSGYRESFIDEVLPGPIHGAQAPHLGASVGQTLFWAGKTNVASVRSSFGRPSHFKW